VGCGAEGVRNGVFAGVQLLFGYQLLIGQFFEFLAIWAFLWWWHLAFPHLLNRAPLQVKFALGDLRNVVLAPFLAAKSGA
jgi:hypothetical protein